MDVLKRECRPLDVRRRPPYLIRWKGFYQSSVIEYEMDEEDERWLHSLNTQNKQAVLDADRFEEIMDVLEKVSSSLSDH